MSAFSSITPKKEGETPAAAEETTATPSVAENASADAAPDLDLGEGMDIDGFTDWMAAPRVTKLPKSKPHASSSNTEEPAPEETPPSGDEEETRKQNQSWFDRVFGGKKDGPAQIDAEMNDEMYQLSGKMGAELTDGILPDLIKGMHDDDSSDKYKATEKQKSNLAHAWELYLRWIKQTLTPLTYLLFQIFIVYGLNFIFGLFKWLDRIRVFGFHFPWSEKWKLKRDKMEQRHQEPAPTAPAPNPETKAEPKSSTPAKEPAPPVEMQTCMYWELKNGEGVKTPKEFPKGKGVPKTCKQPELIGKFSHYKAFIAYGNATKKLGKKA